MRRFLVWSGIILIVALIAGRIYLPTFLRHHVQRALDQIPDYKSRVGDIGVSLWRGAYVIEDLELWKENGKVKVPFFKAPRIDLSVQWKALFHGSLVGEIELDKPELNFVYSPNPASSQVKADSSWRTAVKDLFPLRINHFAIKDGEIHYRDFHSDPRIDIYLQHLDAEAHNLTNSAKISKSLEASLKATALAQSSGKLNLNVKFDPWAEQPTFDLTSKLEKLNLTELNQFLRAYADFDVENGTFDLYMELASADGRFRGYVKPFLKDVEVLSLKRDSANPLRLAWEALVAGVVSIVKNGKADSVAARIPMEGSYDSPSPDIWVAIGSLLQHGFYSALKEQLDQSVSIRSVDKSEKEGSKP